MNTTFDYLTGNRKWVVRDFVVWGQSDIFDAAILATEALENTSVIFMRELAGGEAQVVEFTDLVDHRGNQLPASISSPEIIIIPKSASQAFLIGNPGNSSFRIAAPSNLPGNPLVDLLIVEMN
jgi:hypothetical protein